ncbi:MAG: ROK family protein, partial [Moraxellaceae bacterium]
AGELGALKYRDGSLEDYCSGNFFQQFHNISGQALCENAERGDPAAKKILNQFGAHVAAAISAVLLAYDPEVVVLGGSVARAYPFFSENLRAEMETFPFQKIWEKTKLLISNNPSSAVLGAAYLIAK